MDNNDFSNFSNAMYFCAELIISSHFAFYSCIVKNISYCVIWNKGRKDKEMKYHV